MTNIQIIFGISICTLGLWMGSAIFGQVKNPPTKEAQEMPAKNHKFTNKLIESTSPYLLQHAHNPVNWYPWSDEVIALAKKSNKPIFLSIGYAACHWCHVMEHETFEDEEVAKILNRDYICIKVDREERPDIDDIYMASVQMLTGSGGWPMSVWLTPDLKPFYGGTYFPKTDKNGRPGFITVINHLTKVWKERREEVLASSSNLSKAIAEQSSSQIQGRNKLDVKLLEAGVEGLRQGFDEISGGFGRAPKFPNSNAIMLLLRMAHKTGDKSILKLATYTLDKMAQGGMYDQIGGGFHRYSTDSQWLVPHFEKMLYDNGQLSATYLQAYQLTGDKYYRQIVEEIFAYQLSEMTDEGGAFHSTEDADSEGQEGKYYIWAAEELKKLLGEKDYRIFAHVYNFKDEGNFSSHEEYHKGLNIPHLTGPISESAKALNMEEAALVESLAAIKSKIYQHRDKRVHPGLDDKVITSWNGLMIASLARGYQVLGDKRYLDAAQNAARFVLKTLRGKDGSLLRTYRKGKSHLPGFLDDYAFLITSLVDLYESDFDPTWLEEADVLCKIMIERFWDKEDGGFFFSIENKNLIARLKPSHDGAEPSGNAVACEALFRLSMHLGNESYKDKAIAILELNQANIARAPRGYLKMLCVAYDYLLYPTKEVAVVGDITRKETITLLQEIRRDFLPNKVVAWSSDKDTTQTTLKSLPLLAGKGRLGGKPAAYVCENYTCKEPVVNPQDLKKLLSK